MASPHTRRIGSRVAIGRITTALAARAALVVSVAAVALVAVAALVPVSCASTGAAPTPEAFSGSAPPAAAEVRAVWVVRHSLSSPAAVREVVAQAAAGGFNTLLVQVRGRGDALYGTSQIGRAHV